MTKELPSPELLRKLLRYDPETGKLFWRKRTIDLFEIGKYSAEHAQKSWNNRYANTEAFTCLDRDGYKTGRIFNKAYLAHRVIWAMRFDEWPEKSIDHKNRKKDDNSIANLRKTSQSENLRNTVAYANNKSGYKGVSWKSGHNKWVSQIRHNGKKHCLGYFDCPREAHAAYCKAAKKFHGQYANTKVVT